MGVIDEYLAALATSIGHNRDREDLLAETEDHLRTAAERLVADGMTPHVAEDHAVRRLGAPDAPARSLADTGDGIAVPTTRTRRAGAVAALGAPLWLAYPVLGFLADRADEGQDWEGTPRTLYIVGSSLLFLAGVITLIGAMGLAQRHGGFGRLGWAALALYSLALVVMFGAAWFEQLWLALLAATIAVLAPTLWRRGLVPRAAIAALVAAVPVAGVSIAVLHIVAFGPVDSFGDRNQAFAVGAGIGLAVLAVGVAVTGRWMWSEQAIEVDNPGHVSVV